MNKDVDLLKHQQEEIERLVAEITGEAKKVVEDYEKNPSEASGSITEVHVESPILDGDVCMHGNSWNSGCSECDELMEADNMDKI